MLGLRGVRTRGDDVAAGVERPLRAIVGQDRFLIVFAGSLIGRFGSRSIMRTGVAAMLGCVALGMIARGVLAYGAGLVLPGVGWNFRRRPDPLAPRRRRPLFRPLPYR